MSLIRQGDAPYPCTSGVWAVNPVRRRRHRKFALYHAASSLAGVHWLPGSAGVCSPNDNPSSGTSAGSCLDSLCGVWVPRGKVFNGMRVPTWLRRGTNEREAWRHPPIPCPLLRWFEWMRHLIGAANLARKASRGFSASGVFGPGDLCKNKESLKRWSLDWQRIAGCAVDQRLSDSKEPINTLPCDVALPDPCHKFTPFSSAVKCQVRIFLSCG